MSCVNPLLHTDVYKMGHMEQYAPGTTRIYSNIVTRSARKYPAVLNFGTQYYLSEYLSKPITKAHVDEFLDLNNRILSSTSNEVYTKLRALEKLGFVPLIIKALPEGNVYPIGTPLLTATNHPDYPEFAWTVGFYESLLLKIWNTCTVATFSRKLKQLCYLYADLTCDSNLHVDYQVHDFGYRGCSSEETAAISGMSHLVNFLGTDTVLAVKYAKDYYYATDPIGLSVPASEHSVMCSFGPTNEIDAFRHMLKTYPTGIVSIVCDTYNIWKVLSEFVPLLKDEILARNGKVVFRPDSGDQEKILCGNPDASDPLEKKGVFQLLFEQFGEFPNKKGYRTLHPKVGVVYGDGFYYDKFHTVFNRMKTDKISSAELTVGVGGILLQQHNRDDMGFSMKATYIEQNGNGVNIFKDPITDPGKKSLKGLLSVTQEPYHGGYTWKTNQEITWEQEKRGALQVVFNRGKLLNQTTFDEIRKRADSSIVKRY